jgi:hypothetical protein
MEKKIKRKGFKVYIDEDVWNKYHKVIKPTGQSVSRVLETMMRITTSEDAEGIYDIFDQMFEVAKKHEKD